MGPSSRRVFISLVFFLSFLPRDSVLLSILFFEKKLTFPGSSRACVCVIVSPLPACGRCLSQSKKQTSEKTVWNIPLQKHTSFPHRDLDKTFSQDGDVVELESLLWESGSNRKQLRKKFRGCWKSLRPSSEVSFPNTVLSCRLQNI